MLNKIVLCSYSLRIKREYRKTTNNIFKNLNFISYFYYKLKEKTFCKTFWLATDLQLRAFRTKLFEVNNYIVRELINFLLTLNTTV